MKKKKYLLYGMGKTNTSVKSFFIENNIQFKEYIDGTDNYDLEDIDYVIKSPGISPHTKLLNECNSKGIPVINDLELFYLFYPKAKLIIITGTNGKTSTSRMLSIVLSKKYKCYLGGNIGLPLFNLKSKNNFKNEFVIVEASSFMLEHCYLVKPFIYVITNVFPHHLDYHQTFENYLNAKTKLIKNIDINGLLITPKEIDNSMYFGNKIIINDQTNKIKIESNKITYNNEIINSYVNTSIVPYHQLLNMSVVSEIALFLNVPIERIRKGFEDCTCEKYRMELIYQNDSTLIINDAKSTNFNASVAAINSVKDFTNNIHWILGGHGNTNFSFEDVNSYISKYYLYGENANQLENKIKLITSNCIKFDTLEDVIKNIINDQSNKVILYSPAAQSYDQYNNFEERGKHFNELINKYWHN